MVLTDSFTYLFTPQPTAEGLVVPGNSSARGEAGGFSRRGALWTQALSQEVRGPRQAVKDMGMLPPLPFFFVFGE